MAVFRYIPFIILCAAVWCGAGAEEPHAAPFLARPVKDGIYVRLDSSVRSAPIATLSREDTVRVIAVQYDWYKIILPERITGSIRQDYVATEDGRTGTVTARGVNIRNKPGLNNPVIGTANENAPVHIRGKEGEWYIISVYPYGEGWVYSKLFEEAPAEEPAPTKGQELLGVNVRQPPLTGYELTVTNLYPQGFGYLKVGEQGSPGTSSNGSRNECVVEGALKRNMHTQWCEVPYTVVTDNGSVFINSAAFAEAMLNRTVRLTGSYVIGSTCVYVEAKTIEEK